MEATATVEAGAHPLAAIPTSWCWLNLDSSRFNITVMSLLLLFALLVADNPASQCDCDEDAAEAEEAEADPPEPAEAESSSGCELAYKIGLVDCWELFRSPAARVASLSDM